MFHPIRHTMACTLILGLASVGIALAADEDKAADKKGEPAAQLVDLLKDAVDPYVPGEQRQLFLKAAGVDTELDEKEFNADAEKEKSFVRSFDKWSQLVRFDVNGNKKLDWFECDQYRRAVRKAGSTFGKCCFGNS